MRAGFHQEEEGTGFHQEEEGTGHLGLRREIYAKQLLYSTFGEDNRFITTSSSAEHSP